MTGTATVTVTTNFGNIVIKVDGSLGPNAAGAFVAMASCGYYNDVIFHRVVPGFIIQSGDGQYARLPNLVLDKMGQGGPGWTVKDDKVTTTYKRGTVAMARTSSADSGSTQFFIVLSDSAQTTLGASTANNYAIFGSVTAGLDVVDRIAAVPLGGEPESRRRPLHAAPAYRDHQHGRHHALAWFRSEIAGRGASPWLQRLAIRTAPRRCDRANH